MALKNLSSRHVEGGYSRLVIILIGPLACLIEQLQTSDAISFKAVHDAAIPSVGPSFKLTANHETVVIDSQVLLCGRQQETPILAMRFDRTRTEIIESLDFTESLQTLDRFLQILPHQTGVRCFINAKGFELIKSFPKITVPQILLRPTTETGLVRRNSDRPHDPDPQDHNADWQVLW